MSLPPPRPRVPAALTQEFLASVEFVLGRGHDPATVYVTVAAPGALEVRFSADVGEGEEPRATPDVARPAGVPEGALWLSPLERDVLAALEARGGWITADEVGRALGNDRASNELKGVLHNLVERKILVARGSRGYGLA